MRSVIVQKLCDMDELEDKVIDPLDNSQMLKMILSTVNLTVVNISTAYDKLFESKIFLLFSSLPRTHLLVLKSIHSCYSNRDASANTIGLKEAEISHKYNTQFCRDYAVPKISSGELFEIL